jgi:hypothetical protein
MASSLLAGEFSVDAAHGRLQRTLGRRWLWARPLAGRFIAAFRDGTRPRHVDAVHFLANDRQLQRDYWRNRWYVRIAAWIPEPAVMRPVPAMRSWDVARIETLGELAQWLSVRPQELEWFADLKVLGNKLDNAKLQHYRYKMIRKRSGAVRVIESPKPRLKEMQRRILSEILDRVPAHPAAHGFVKARSIVTFAEAHSGKSLVLRMDLEDFFPQFPAARVQAFFRTLGYPESVADALGGICSNAVPRNAWSHRPLGIDPTPWSQARALYGFPHLPQGAPTSPALANIEAYRLDCRLAGLSESVGANYGRYADDLAFSGGGEFARCLERFATQVAAISMEEGFSINFHKTRLMRQGVRQHLAGLVVNQKPNLKRRDVEKLEAILFNCARFGIETQNREGVPDFRAHLAGRIGFVEMVNPVTGARLRRIFDALN